MAWTDVECNQCGQNHRVQMYGPHKQRDWKVANWSGICEECSSKNKAEATAKAEDSAKEKGLPALTGSEKQIAWAETIRAKKLAGLEKEAGIFRDYLKKNPDARLEKDIPEPDLPDSIWHFCDFFEDGLFPPYLAASLKLTGKALGILSAQTESRFWIDRRSDSTEDFWEWALEIMPKPGNWNSGSGVHSAETLAEIKAIYKGVGLEVRD